MGRKMRFAVVLWVFTGLCLMASPALSWPIPDTGQTKCYDFSGDEILCHHPVEPFYGQDATYTINPPSYTKLGYGGEELPDTATEWIMVQDDVTGLIWEVKQNKDGNEDYDNPNDADNAYTWYDSNPENNGGDPGTPGDGTDTVDFINALNAKSFGGFSDWRLPLPEELQSIVNYGAWEPAEDGEFFPNTASSCYWSSSSHAANPSSAWLVYFLDGLVSNGDKSYNNHARAVRAGQPRSFDYLIINGDGTVTDTWTGLMWQQVGSDSDMSWADALSDSEWMTLGGYADWRLPNIKELASIVDRGRYDPAIDETVFSGDLSIDYWSSSSHAGGPGNAWDVNFSNGYVHDYSKSYSNRVRAVRGGQSPSFGHLIISAPAQASFWNIGENMPISWDTAGISGNVSIKLSRQGGRGGTFDTIITDSTPNDGSFDWTVTGQASVNCALRITPLSDPDKSTTQSLFVIREPPVLIDPSELTISEPDGAQSFTISLNMAPTAPVLVPLYLSAPDQCVLSATSVTLTESNWSDGVEVTVTALDDDRHEDERNVTINTGPAESDDPDFNGIDPDDITVTVRDNDPETLTITSVEPNTGPLNEALDVSIYGTAFDDYTLIELTGIGYIKTYPYTDITVHGSGHLSLTLQSPPNGGDYNLTVINNSGEATLENAVTFDDAGVIAAQAGKKAVVVAGSRSMEDALWPATRTCANLACKALRFQGYTADRVRYLSPESFIDVTGDGVNDRHADSTLAALTDAVTVWAAEPGTTELILYLTDHGTDGAFRLNDAETLSATLLDAWLDALQDGSDIRVIVILDACRSGSFMSALTAPEGAERYVVASTGADQSAYFADGGETSFSYFFWEAVYYTGKLYQAFSTGERNIGQLFQYPIIDVDGDGVPDTITSALFNDDIIIGRGIVTASDPLKINRTCGSLTVGCDNTATLWVEDLVYTDGLSDVWAQVVPPAPETFDPSEPVQNLHRVRLTDTNADGRYEGGYSDFRQDGNYAVLFFLVNKRGRQSLPTRISVFRSCGVTPEPGDLDGDELVTLADGLLALQVMSGREPRTFRADYPSAGVDVNENDRVDMAEAIFAFQKVAGLRD